MNFTYRMLLFSLFVFVFLGCSTKPPKNKDWKEQERKAARFKKKLPALEKIISIQMSLGTAEMQRASQEEIEEKREKIELDAIQTARKITSPIAHLLQYTREIQAKMRWIEKQNSPPTVQSDEARKLGKQAIAVAYEEIERLRDNESLPEVQRVLRAQHKALRERMLILGKIQKEHQEVHRSPKSPPK